MFVTRSSAVALVVLLLSAGLAHAKSAEQIDAETDAALATLDEKLPGSREFVDRAKGVLVFPEVIEAGLFVEEAHAVVARMRTSAARAAGVP